MQERQILAELYCQKAKTHYFYYVSMCQNVKIHLEAPSKYMLSYYTFHSGKGDSFKILYIFKKDKLFQER